MNLYAPIIAVIAGICLGYSILFLFIGMRRGQEKRLNLTFALFAFAYAGTLLMGIWYRSQTTAVSYLEISRWDSIFFTLAIIALNWYVAAYTNVGGKLYLWGITAVISIVTLAIMLTPTLTFTEMPTLTTIPLPWEGEVATLVGAENSWGVLFLLTLLLTLGFIIFAGVRQWLRGERQAALVLLGGMSWFIIALLYEILAEVGFWVYIPLAETGFLGIAIAMSLQMANSIIKTDEALAASQRNLEAAVIERTAELATAQAQLIEKAQATAVYEERSRIARDLHDAVTQTIYSASLIVEVLPQVWARSPEEGTRNLTKLRQLVRGALAEMRTLLFELRPSALENAQLEILLPQLADAFTGRTRVPVDVDLDVNGRSQLPAEVKIALYRMTQEAFNNIAKHASATAVTLRLKQQSLDVRLSLEDNGRGFDPNRVSAENMGLQIIQERAAAIHARVELTSVENQGTHLQIIWPAEQPISNGENQ